MRSGLFWKLFLLQVAAAIGVLFVVLMLSRTFSLRGFAEYIETRERERVAQIAGELADKVADGTALVAAFQALPPPRPRHPQGMMPPVPPVPDLPPQPDQPGQQGPAPSPRHEMRMLVRRIDATPPLQLQAPDGQYLAGDDRPMPLPRLREPIRAGGQLIGYLAWPQIPVHPEQEEFAHRQLRHLVVIAPVALAIAAAFAALITALIVWPIRRLSEGAAALARREFAVRVDDRRRDELGALAADFNRLAEALQGYDARQRQWLADIAHELRTPLAVLRGEVEAVLDGVRTATPETMRSLRQEVGRLEALIQDLHLVSLAESGGLRLTRAPSDLGALVREGAARFSERLAAKGFELKLDVQDGLVVELDSLRLEQVLANLFDNVLMHASPGVVSVSARAEGGVPVVGIADSGPGVPAEALPRLFDRLYRVESARTRSGGGAGLGLAICKSIIEAHGWSITAQRSVAGGLAIVIRT